MNFKANEKKTYRSYEKRWFPTLMLNNTSAVGGNILRAQASVWRHLASLNDLQLFDCQLRRDLKTHLFVWHCVSFSALAVFSRNALLKSTFYLLTYLQTELHRWIWLADKSPLCGSESARRHAHWHLSVEATCHPQRDSFHASSTGRLRILHSS